MPVLRERDILCRSDNGVSRICHTAFTVVLIAGGMLLVAGSQVDAMWEYWRELAARGGSRTDTDGYRKGTDYARFTSFLDPFRRRSRKRLAGGSVAAGYWEPADLRAWDLATVYRRTYICLNAQNDFILAIIGEELGFMGIFWP